MTTKQKNVEVTEAAVINFTDGHTLESFMDSEKGRELGYKAAQKYWKDNGAKTKVTGFRAKFYAELAKGSMTDSDVLEFAKSNGGSENDIKQISHFYAIAELANEIRKSLEVKK
jgi:hypothetical protein